ncbi:hypothetical protein, partial [Merdimonas faecis]|uniref:hypothetical protein n=1 Tax=Merdimonas faecis TaxID=1653435 RepID=UPI0022E00154
KFSKFISFCLTFYLQTALWSLSANLLFSYNITIIYDDYRKSKDFKVIDRPQVTDITKGQPCFRKATLIFC